MDQLIRWRWWILAFLGVVIGILELFEHHLNVEPADSTFIEEVVLFIVLLTIVGILLEGFLRALKVKTHAENILNLKHKLSQQLAAVSDWDELIDFIMNYLSSIILPDRITLSLYDPDSDRLQTVAEKKYDGEATQLPASPEVLDLCQSCALNKPNSLHLTESCLQGEYNRYCLPLVYSNTLAAMLHFYLHAGKPLAEEKIDILNNIGPEIAIAIRTVQQQKALAKLQIAEAAAAERRSISQDLHDTLGQNLAYMRLKLEQLAGENSPQIVTDNKPELVRLHHIANESYELVRGTLAVLQAETSLELSTLLLEHSNIIANRANFTVETDKEGEPFLIPPQVERQIFYVFREALNNIEKHARATKVNIALLWGKNDLTLRIEDNGKGFNPHVVDHNLCFGLTIMSERIAR